MKAVAKKWTRRLAIVIGAVLILVAVLFAILQTPWAKRKITAYIEKTLSRMTNSNVDIGRLRGLVPFTVKIDRAEFDDDEGTWLELRDLDLRWAPFALARGRIKIHEASLASIRLERLPPEMEKKEKPLPEIWTDMIPSIIVKDLRVDELQIGESLLGEKVVLKVEGRIEAQNPAEKAEAKIKIERIDKTGSKASIAVELAGKSPVLTANIQIHESPGGFMVSHINRPEAGAMDIFLKGDGPLSSWKAELSAKADDLGELTTVVTVALPPKPAPIEELDASIQGGFELSIRDEDAELTAKAQFDFKENRIDLRELDARGYKSKATGNLSYDIKSKLFDGELIGDIEDMTILETLIGKKIEGAASCRAKLNSSSGVQTIVLHAESKDVTTPYGEVGEMMLDADLADVFASIRGTATVGLKSFRKDDLTVDELQLYVDGTRENIKFTCDADGNRRAGFEIHTLGSLNPAESLHLESLEAKYGDVSGALSAPATIHWNGTIFDFEGIDLAIGEGNIRASGTLTSEDIALDIAYKNLPTSLLRNLAGSDIDGDASGMMHITGPLTEPEVEFKVEFSNLASADPIYTDIAPAEIKAEGNLKEGTLKAVLEIWQMVGEKALKGKCDIPIEFSLYPLAIDVGDEGPFEASLTANLQIEKIFGWLLPEGYKIHGNVDTGINISGTVDSPSIRGSVALSKCSLTEPSGRVYHVNAKTNIGFDNGVLTISDLSIDGPGGDLTGDLTLATGKRFWEISARTDISGSLVANGKIEEIIPLLLPDKTDLELTGPIASTLNVGGFLGNPTFAGDIRVDKITYTNPYKESLTVNGKADFQVGDGFIRIKEFSIVENGSSAKGHLSLSTGERFWDISPASHIEGNLTAEGKLGMIVPFILSESHNLDADVLASIAADGTLAEPDISGTVTVRNGSYENLVSGTILKNLELSVVSEGSRMVLEHLSAIDGQQGKVSASGWLDISREKDFAFEIDVVLQNTTLARTDEITAAVGGNVKLSGTPNNMTLAGSLVPGPVNVRLPERSAARIAELDVIEINLPDGKSSFSQTPGLRAIKRLINLDLELDTTGRVFVRGHGLDSEWEGKLSVKGNSHAPQITGQLAIKRGDFNFLDRKFSISQGSILFTGDTPPEPFLNITAETVTADITAIITLSGSIMQPELKLSSRPVLPSDEIIARVLFGSEVTKLTAVQAIRLAQVVNSLAKGESAYSFLESARSIMKVDRLELKQSKNSSSGGAISAGKYVRDDIYVEVERDISEEGSRLSVEKRLTPRIYIESEIDEKGNTGIGIRLKRDY